MKEGKTYRFFSLLFDILAISIAFFLSDFFASFYFKHIELIDRDWLIFFLVIALYLFFTTRFKINDYRYFDNRVRVLKDAIKALTFSFSLVAFVVIIIRYSVISRAFFFSFFILSLIMVYISQILSRYLYFKLVNKKGKLKKFVLMVGTDFSSRELVKDIEGEVIENFKIIGFLTYSSVKKDKFMGYDILGTSSDLEQVIANNVVDMIIVFPNQFYLQEVRDIVKTCEIEGLQVFVYSHVFNFLLADMSVVKYNGRQLLKFAASEKEPYMLMIKRLIDIAGSLFFLTILSPIYLLAIISIKIESKGKGSVFYNQERCGLNGRKFKMFKFRSMIEGADKMKIELKESNEAEGPIFKMKKDPRITKVGAFIRKFSIDELPQLYNVLIGDMSLVGPRPPLASEVMNYDRWQRRRLTMRPGITCIWQVNGRSNIPFKKWVQMDLDYIDNWSLFLDFHLLVKTIPAVLLGRGAY